MPYSKVFGQAEHVVVREAKQFARMERGAQAQVLTRIAVVDARKLYLQAGYPSLHDYCVSELDLTDAAANKRIRVARVGAAHPAIFDMLADGRLHPSAVLTLSPYLEGPGATELLAAVAGKPRAEIEYFLACRFPKPDLLTMVTTPSGAAHGEVADSLAPGRVAPTASAECAPQVVLPPARSRVMQLSADRVGLQVTVSRATHDKLQRAKDLLGHSVEPGDLAEVLDRALDALIEKLEKRRFAATDKPRTPRGRRSGNGHHIPAHVRRLVRERDGERCTFTSNAGHRCECRRGLEFDHVTPVARGGESSVANLRLRCVAHNQYEAERVFGEGFMRGKREAAKARAAEQVGARRASKQSGLKADITNTNPNVELRRNAALEVRQYGAETDLGPTRADEGRLPESEAQQPALESDLSDVRAALRELRFTKAEIETGLTAAVLLPPGAAPEDRLRAALKVLKLRSARKELPVRTVAA